MQKKGNICNVLKPEHQGWCKLDMNFASLSLIQRCLHRLIVIETRHQESWYCYPFPLLKTKKIINIYLVRVFLIWLLHTSNTSSYEMSSLHKRSDDHTVQRECFPCSTPSKQYTLQEYYEAAQLLILRHSIIRSKHLQQPQSSKMLHQSYWN